MIGAPSGSIGRFGSAALDAVDRTELKAAARWLAARPDQRPVLIGKAQ